jgi:hypothetical protein
VLPFCTLADAAAFPARHAAPDASLPPSQTPPHPIPQLFPSVPPPERAVLRLVAAEPAGAEAAAAEGPLPEYVPPSPEGGYLQPIFPSWCTVM